MAFVNTSYSRYEKTRGFSGSDNRQIPFPGTRAREIQRTEGVIEHTIGAGERLDLLALHYYNNPRKWWRILDANPFIFNAGDVVLDQYEGSTIVIPPASDTGASG